MLRNMNWLDGGALT